MTELEFQALSREGYNRIALVSEAFADLETPLSLYLKLAHATSGGRNTFLLESVVGGERFGRYSFIGLSARTELRVKNGTTQVLRDGAVVETSAQPPLAFIEAFRARYKVALPAGMPRFCGGLAGYFGYEAARYIEPRLMASARKHPRPDPLDLPDILLLLCEELAVIDNLSGRLYLIVYADPAQPEAYARARARLQALREHLRYSVTAPPMASSQVTPTERDFDKADYIKAVEQAKEYIAAGDFMQVQVGQRLRKRYTQSPLSLYRALRSLNPSPYMYFYNFGDFQVVGSSPEILVRQEATAEGEKVTIRPL
ncbi:MAG: chorismate-binding protein, partial [Thiomonas delicata]